MCADGDKKLGEEPPEHFGPLLESCIALHFFIKLFTPTLYYQVELINIYLMQLASRYEIL